MVQDADGNVICQTGGAPCLLQKVSDATPNYFTYKYNNVEYAIYNDGRVVKQGEDDKVFCTGGAPCILSKTSAPAPTYFTYTEAGKSFAIGYDGTVKDDKDAVLCSTGGAPCLLTKKMLLHETFLGNSSPSFSLPSTQYLTPLACFVVALVAFYLFNKETEKVKAEQNQSKVNYMETNIKEPLIEKMSEERIKIE